METFRLWFEDDKEISRFKRLAYEKVNVSITDVLKMGIHPWQGGNTHKTLGERFVQILNSDDLKLGEMKQARYCPDISNVSYYIYYYDTSPFEQTLKRIKESTYFHEIKLVQDAFCCRGSSNYLWSQESSRDTCEEKNYSITVH